MTLLEVVISIALIGLLLGALLSFFWQTVEIRKQAGHAAARTQIVKQMFAKITGELRNTVALEQVGFPDLEQFVGDRRSITFLTTPLPPEHSYVFFRESEDNPAPRHDLLQVTYELWIDPEEETEEGDPLVGGVLRTERRALDPFETKETIPEGEDLLYLRHDLWAPELGYLEFRYFDGVEWSTTWNVSQGNRLPHLVQITVGFDSLLREDLEDQDLHEYPIDEYPLGPEESNPDRFTTIVRLPAADEMFSARLNRLSDEVEEIYEFGGLPGEEGEGEGEESW
ncbi:MAG: hypothetical protein KAY37_16290 [Phycisphaerae bacterium]|nr:hypothetical protein [Phycisphaerae bacterium]